ncbi:unnamed protein product, partial [Effrenium voratum]
ASPFRAGDAAEIHGLVRKPENNGKKVAIIEWLEKEERFKVEFPSGSTTKIKPENLKRVEAPLAPPVVREIEEEEAEKASPRREKAKKRRRSSSSRRSGKRARKERSQEQHGVPQVRPLDVRPPDVRPPDVRPPDVRPPDVRPDAAPRMKGVGKGGKGRNIQISKTLARVLRHTATSQGVKVQADGFCLVQDLLVLPDLRSLGCTVEDVKAAVQTNDKKRFEIKEDSQSQVWIRAVQGHSMKVVEDDSLLKKLAHSDPDLPTVCVHGTYRRFLESIQRNGLIAGGGISNRNHVHFAPYEPHDGRVISGMRYNCEVAVYVDLPAALKEGVPFFRSANEVILSPGINGTVPAKFLLKEAAHKLREKLKKEMSAGWNIINDFEQQRGEEMRKQVDTWSVNLESEKEAAVARRAEDGKRWVEKFAEVQRK